MSKTISRRRNTSTEKTNRKKASVCKQNPDSDVFPAALFMASILLPKQHIPLKIECITKAINACKRE